MFSVRNIFNRISAVFICFCCYTAKIKAEFSTCNFFVTKINCSFHINLTALIVRVRRTFFESNFNKDIINNICNLKIATDKLFCNINAIYFNAFKMIAVFINYAKVDFTKSVNIKLCTVRAKLTIYKHITAVVIINGN